MVAFDEADSTTVDRPSPSVNPAYEVIGEENLTANGSRTENLRVPYSHLVSESTSSLQLRSAGDSTYSSLPQDRQYQNSSFENGHECKGYSFVPNSTQRQKAATSGTPAVEPAYEFVIPPNINPTNEQTDEDSNAYWNPGHTAMEIYDQMSSKKFIEIPRSAIEEQDKMGEGEFGIVYKGQWKLPNEKSLPVAVKTLKSTASNDERIKLLQEAVIMGQFRHPHILKLHGVVSLSEPVSIILEYMSKGDLRNHLIALRKRTAKGERSHLKQLEGELLTFCQEIADGMRYLSGKSFVHRDLATRNILLTSDNHCKIGDFGLTKELSEEYYYKPRGGQIPVKWTAPEAIFYKKYTTKSDVWSYGMVMYEIWSLGRKPFDDWQIQEIVDVLETGYCLPPPPGCPRQAYQLMVTCWNRKFHQRPTFDELHHSLVALTTHTHELDVPVPNGASALSGILGAPLKHGHKLYIDLQETYKE
jgi:ephrin-B